LEKQLAPREKRTMTAKEVDGRQVGKALLEWPDLLHSTKRIVQRGTVLQKRIYKGGRALCRRRLSWGKNLL